MQDDEVYQAKCSCGWMGGTTRDMNLALDDAFAHRINNRGQKEHMTSLEVSPVLNNKKVVV